MPSLSRPAAPAPTPVTIGPAERSAPSTIRGLRTRRGVAVAGTGLMLTMTAFALAACGSDPSTAKVGPTPQPSTSVVKKNAGVLHTDLTVINNSGQALPVKVCDPNSYDARDADTDCAYFDGNLQVGEAASGQNGAQGIDGEIHYPDGSITYIHSDNPDIGQPYINLSTLPGGNGDSTGNVTLGTGEGKPATVRDHTYQLERWGDTSYKEMRVIIK